MRGLRRLPKSSILRSSFASPTGHAILEMKLRKICSSKGSSKLSRTKIYSIHNIYNAHNIYFSLNFLRRGFALAFIQREWLGYGCAVRWKGGEICSRVAVKLILFKLFLFRKPTERKERSLASPLGLLLPLRNRSQHFSQGKQVFHFFCL